MAGGRLIVGITGATGAIFGVRILEMLAKVDVETHLILSRWGARTLVHETPYRAKQVEAMASVVHSAANQGASISSGSFLTDGMVVAPCSMKTLSAIAHGHGSNLITRAADVVLKERRKLVLVVREAPFNEIHLDNMLRLSRIGVVIFPPVPAFYNHPKTLDDMVNHLVMRVLDQFGFRADIMERWSGQMSTGGDS